MWLISSQILEDCIPQGIYKYLSDREKCRHNHKSLILNLACGATVNTQDAHKSSLQG